MGSVPLYSCLLAIYIALDPSPTHGSSQQHFEGRHHGRLGDPLVARVAAVGGEAVRHPQAPARALRFSHPRTLAPTEVGLMF